MSVGLRISALYPRSASPHSLTPSNAILRVRFDGFAVLVNFRVEGEEQLNRDVVFVGKFRAGVVVHFLSRVERIPADNLAWDHVALCTPRPWLAVVCC